MNNLAKALFLDRDGIINVDKSYVYKLSDVEWMPGIVDLIKLAQKNNFLVIVLTNQSGIERGYYGTEDVLKLHEEMSSYLENHGATIHRWYFCSQLDSPDRKPNPGMMIKAQKDFKIDLAQSIMIGDKASDVLNLTGPEYLLIKGKYPLENIASDVKIFDDLFAITNYLIKTNRLIS